MKCPACNDGITHKYVRDSLGRSERVEADCGHCGGTGQIVDPEEAERQIEVLNRIADALERVASALEFANLAR